MKKDNGIRVCIAGIFTFLIVELDKVEKLNLKFFRSVIETMQNDYGTIVNYFENRSTNASAESFQCKG